MKGKLAKGSQALYLITYINEYRQKLEKPGKVICVSPGCVPITQEERKRMEMLEDGICLAMGEPVLRAQAKEMDPVAGKYISGAVRRDRMNHISIDQNPYKKPVRKWLADRYGTEQAEDPDCGTFQAVLDKFFGGKPDERTLRILKNQESGK